MRGGRGGSAVYICWRMRPECARLVYHAIGMYGGSVVDIVGSKIGVLLWW